MLIRRKKLENLSSHLSHRISGIIDIAQEVTRLRGTFNWSFTRSGGRRVTKEWPFASSPRLYVASIYRHGNKLCVRVTGKPQRQVVILQTVSCETGVIAHSPRTSSAISSAIIYSQFHVNSRIYAADDIDAARIFESLRISLKFIRPVSPLPFLFCRWYMRTSSFSIERNLIFAVKREDASSLCNCAQR